MVKADFITMPFGAADLRTRIEQVLQDEGAYERR
jgi:hypothetical protein